MKKTILKTLVAITFATTAFLFNSCKPEEQETPENNTIEAQFEQPRYLDVADGNIYMTCYYPMSVVRFDPAQKAFTGVCNLGQFHPEGIAAVNGKLYIASSNISDEQGNYSYDNKLYIVDIASFKLVDSVTIGVNPQVVKKLDNNHIVFNTWGDYATDFGGTYIMNTDNKEIISLNVALTCFDVYNGDVYGCATTYNPDYSTSTTFYRIDGNTHQSTEILPNFSTADGIYGISINPVNGDIVVTTNGNYTTAGDCYVFANDGTSRMNATQVGNLPKKAVAVDANTLLVLNEGGWGANNAGISRVDVSNATAVANYFADNNGRGLGDVAQDIITIGNKAYITVSFSNSLEIMDINTGKSSRVATTK